MNVAPIIGATDGEDYYLTCTVTVNNGLMANAVSVTWLGHDGSVVSEDNTTTAAFLSNSNTTLSSRLTFQPLKSTHGGNYSCKATIMVPGLNEPPPMTAPAQLVVTSKSVQSHRWALPNYTSIILSIIGTKRHKELC